MTHITFDYSKVLGQFVGEHELDYLQPQVSAADAFLRQGTGPGSDFLGWMDLPENYDKEEFSRKPLKRLNQIAKYSWLLVLVVRTLAQKQQLTF